MSKSGRDLVERWKALETLLRSQFTHDDTYAFTVAAVKRIPKWEPDAQEAAVNTSCRHRALLKSIAGDILDSGGVNRGDYDSMAIVEDVRAEFERLKREPAPQAVGETELMEAIRLALVKADWMSGDVTDAARVAARAILRAAGVEVGDEG